MEEKHAKDWQVLIDMRPTELRSSANGVSQISIECGQAYFFSPPSPSFAFNPWLPHPWWPLLTRLRRLRFNSPLVRPPALQARKIRFSVPLKDKLLLDCNLNDPLQGGSFKYWYLNLILGRLCSTWRTTDQYTWTFRTRKQRPFADGPEAY